MTYPIIERTYFDNKNTAMLFAKAIGNIKNGWIVSGYGLEDGRTSGPYYIETVNDPFATKDELMRRFGLMV